MKTSNKTRLLFCIALVLPMVVAQGQTKDQKLTTTTVASDKYGKGGTLETTSDENGQLLKEVWKDKNGKKKEVHVLKDELGNEVWEFQGLQMFTYNPKSKEMAPFSGAAVIKKDVEPSQFREWMEKFGAQFAKDGTYSYPWNELKETATSVQQPAMPASELKPKTDQPNIDPDRPPPPSTEVFDKPKETKPEAKPEKEVPPTGQGTPPIFKPNEINFNFSFIREDSDPRFNTYGFNGSYTHYFNPTVGVTADTSAHFKKGSVDLAKIGVVGGVTLCPFEIAKTTDKVTVSTHALFGVSHFKADNGVSSFTENSFTIKLGGALDVNVNEHIFIRLPQIDYAPTFFGSSTQHNVQVGFGVGFRFR